MRTAKRTFVYKTQSVNVVHENSNFGSKVHKRHENEKCEQNV